MRAENRESWFWLPLGLFGAVVGLTFYELATEAGCDGGDSPLLQRVWFVGGLLVVLLSLLTAHLFTRDARMQGRRPRLWFWALWSVTAAVYAGTAWLRLIECAAT